MGSAVTILFGILGMVAATFFIIYIKMFIAKATNVRFTDRSGKPIIDTDSFNNVNEFLKEKTNSLIFERKPINSNVSISNEKEKAYTKQLSTNEQLSAARVKAIMSKRTLIPAGAIGKYCKLKIEKVTSESPLKDESGEQIYNNLPPHNTVKQKVIFCKSNSGIEMQKPEVIDVLKAAIRMEKQGDIQNAHTLYLEYLETIHFRFAITNCHNLYNQLKKDDEVIGRIELLKKGNITFLTLNCNSVRYTNN